jgi:hypothetical protein
VTQSFERERPDAGARTRRDGERGGRTGRDAGAAPVGGPPRVRTPIALATVLVVVLVIALSVSAQRPPPPLGLDAPATAFSAARALEHLTWLASAPRPVGSDALVAARDGLLAELEALGLQTEVQATTAIGSIYPGTALVENVLGRWNGSASTGAVLLIAHYDSVPSGPGAADNGAAVVAVLEALRTLRAGPPLANDVIVLFSDAEEVGLLGAEAFVAEHAWLDDVALVINLEARGTSGPSVLVETSAGNRRLIETFARVHPYPSAGSLAAALYELLPNDTDYSVFARRGLPGYNFAFIRDAAHYHTARDEPERLDPGSLQHHGEHLIALTRAYGGVDLRAPLVDGGDVVYFDVLRRWLISYPVRWALPSALVTLLALAIVVRDARGRGLARTWGVTAGIGVAAVAAGAAGAVSAAALVVLTWIQPAYGTSLLAAVYHADVTVAAFALLAAATVALVATFARRWWTVTELSLGASLLWAVLAVVVSAYLPLGSYLLTWPVLGATLALAWVLQRRRSSAWRISGPERTALGLGAIPLLLLWPAFLVEAAAGLGLTLVAALMVLVGLAVTLLQPLLPALSPSRSATLLPGALFVASVATFVVGANLAGFDERQPWPTSAFYVLDTDLERAAFLSLDTRTDEWTSRFLDGAFLGHVDDLLPDAGELLHANAPVADLPPPTLEVLGDVVEGVTRRLTLRLASERDALQLSLLFHPQTPVEGLWLNGRPVTRLERPEGWTRLTVHGRVGDGVTVELLTPATAPIALVLVDRTNDLLDVPGLGVPPRPADAMPAPSFTSDAVLVRRAWSMAPATPLPIAEPAP